MQTIYSLDTKAGELYIINSIKRMINDETVFAFKNVHFNNRIEHLSPQDVKKSEFIKIMLDNYQIIQPDNNSRDSDILLVKEDKKIAIEITRALNKPFLKISDKQEKNIKESFGNFYYNIQEILKKEFITDKNLAVLWGDNVIHQIIHQTKEKLEKAWSDHYHKYYCNILVVAFDWPEELIKNQQLQAELFTAIKTFYNCVLMDLIQSNVAFFEFFVFAGFNNLELEQLLIYN